LAKTGDQSKGQKRDAGYYNKALKAKNLAKLFLAPLLVENRENANNNFKHIFNLALFQAKNLSALKGKRLILAEYF
jgi:hypothetical protein